MYTRRTVTFHPPLSRTAIFTVHHLHCRAILPTSRSSHKKKNTLAMPKPYIYLPPNNALNATRKPPHMTPKMPIVVPQTSTFQNPTSLPTALFFELGVTVATYTPVGATMAVPVPTEVVSGIGVPGFPAVTLD